MAPNSMPTRHLRGYHVSSSWLRSRICSFRSRNIVLKWDGTSGALLSTCRIKTSHVGFFRKFFVSSVCIYKRLTAIRQCELQLLHHRPKASPHHDQYANKEITVWSQLRKKLKVTSKHADSHCTPLHIFLYALMFAGFQISLGFQVSFD
jgi:hypothetical protein